MKSVVRQEKIESRAGELHKFLSFKMGDENFGIGILQIKEIIEYGEVTSVPMMPEFIRGAINLRGHAVPVVDLSVRLGRGALEINRRSCIVVVEVMTNAVKLEVGITVDAVNEVLDIHPADIEPPPSLGGAVPTDFMRGMGKVQNRFIILLDTDRVLSMKDLHLLGSVSNKNMPEAADKSPSEDDVQPE